MHSVLNNLNCSEPPLAPVPGAEPSMINEVGVGKCLESKCLYSCLISNIHEDKSGSRSGSRALGCVCLVALGSGDGSPAAWEVAASARRHLRNFCTVVKSDLGETRARRGGNQRLKQSRNGMESLSKQRGWDGDCRAGHGTGSAGWVRNGWGTAAGSRVGCWGLLRSLQ